MLTTHNHLSVELLLDTLTPNNTRLTTFRLSIPKVLLAQFNTHRVFSRCASSSRAIPIRTNIANTNLEPVEPLTWRENRPGMVAGNELSEFKHDLATLIWRSHRWYSNLTAWLLSHCGVAKEWANRPLDTHSYAQVIVTSSEWGNFINLRMHHAAQDYMHLLADNIYTLLDNNIPTKAKYGDWHLPYIGLIHNAGEEDILRSVAMCAQVSYRKLASPTTSKVHDIIDKLYHTPMHASPFEHVAVVVRPSDDHKLQRNFNSGLIQYRALVESGMDKAIETHRILSPFVHWFYDATSDVLYQRMDKSIITVCGFDI